MQLANIVHRNADFPETFMIPDENERLGIVRGDVVKLIFDDNERMWVEVVSVDPLLGCSGILKNQPIYPHLLTVAAAYTAATKILLLLPSVILKQLLASGALPVTPTFISESTLEFGDEIHFDFHNILEIE